MVDPATKKPLVLSQVTKPARYIGGETGAVEKNWQAARVRIALIFPDLYEMGMSHVGLKILYEEINRHPLYLAERAYAVWFDMEEKMREHKLALFSLESGRPLHEFDVLGISLPYELTYTNVLQVIDLAGLALMSHKRAQALPLVIAGGTCAFNPEPLADFLDLVVVGDAEEATLAILAEIDRFKQGEALPSVPYDAQVLLEKDRDWQSEKYRLLYRLTSIPGVYVPAFFHVEYRADGVIAAIKPRVVGYEKVAKALVADLNLAPYPVRPIIPNVKPIHDRIGIEVQRGCTRACRFCQAGYIYRPTRQRSPERVAEIAEKSVANSGMDELGLLSLSVGDYSCLTGLLNHLENQFSDKTMAISIPATRTETLTQDVVAAIKRFGQSGFTIAPEAGSARLRRVINKGNAVEDLYQAAENAFSQGWRLIKLYYMLGLPTETAADLEGIAAEAKAVLAIGRRHGKKVDVNVSVSPFVPKPFTPFQWCAQPSAEEVLVKQKGLRSLLRDKALHFKSHDARTGVLEGLFSRGDRRVGAALLAAYQKGCRFDQWGEGLRYDLWREAMTETQTDIDFYNSRERPFDEILPWDHLFAQMRKEFLYEEWQSALTEAFVADCSLHRCQDCGVCDFKTIKNRLYLPASEPVVFKKGNRLGIGSSLGQGGTPAVLQPEDSLAGSQAAAPPLKAWFRFAKNGSAVFFSHLETMEIFKKALARAGLPLVYSQGFHPQIKMSSLMALGVGLESAWEFIEVRLMRSVVLADALAALNRELPKGLCVIETGWTTLESPVDVARVTSFYYQAKLPKQHENSSLQYEGSLLEFDSLAELWWERQHKGKVSRINLKQTIIGAKLLGENRFSFATRVDQGRTVHPKEVVRALFKFDDETLRAVPITKVGVEFKQHEK